ncbi:MAG: 16S rRNA (cytidine(1402)-2'-O)-methyltransferase [Synechococcaceae cyanobacterium]|nr:16S rRNA (cytidine(1402)-2'-O)-methyltransferase [Synechococcaceae cyanobacterium]
MVGTPIGNLDDLSPRARKVLAGADRILCEDTRRSGLLLHRLGIRSRLISFHQHNQTERLPVLLQALAAGECLALISDAGLPSISDPGETLVAAARAAGHPVRCIPGPSAVTTALVGSGLPSGRFCFEGFLPPRAPQRRQRLEALRDEQRTLVLFEAPHRLVALLEDLLEIWGDRPLHLARELTKRHEQHIGPSVSAVLEHFQRVAPQGECTLVLAGAPEPSPPVWDEVMLRQELLELIHTGLTPSQACRQLAERSGQPRRLLYALLHQGKAGDEGGFEGREAPPDDPKAPAHADPEPRSTGTVSDRPAADQAN